MRPIEKSMFASQGLYLWANSIPQLGYIRNPSRPLAARLDRRFPVWETEGAKINREFTWRR